MPGLLSRRRPHPFSAYLGGTGVMLKPDPQTGVTYARKAISGDNVVANAYDYGAYSPFVEKPFVGGPFVGGMGEQVQSSATSTRYRRAENADLSIGGQRRIGPLFHAEALAAGQFVNQMEVGRHGGADTLFALVGRYVYRNTAGAWVLSRDSGGAQHIQGVQFQGTAGQNRFWVTTDSGQLWGYDGAAWAQATLPLGAHAWHVEKVGTSLVIFGDNAARFCNVGDPMLAASWGGPIYVGDFGKLATWLKALDNQPFFFKEDGIFTINADGSVNDLFPELRNTVGAYKGRNASVFRSALWFAYGDGFYQMTGGGSATLTPVGPERLMDLDAGLRGAPVCFVGHADWFGYLGVAVSGNTELLKYGTWTNVGQQSASYQFADVWNGSLHTWAKTVTSVFVTDVVGGQPRLYAGFADGTVEWCVLPYGTPDPADDPSCGYDTTVPSRIVWADHHGMAEADVKHWRGFVANGPLLDTTRYVTVETSTDQGATWTPLGTAFTSSGQRVNTPGALASNILRVREVLHGTATSTPEVTSVDLLEQVRPALVLEYDCTVEARRNLVRRDGLVDRRTGERIRAAMQAVAASAGPVTAEFVDETNHSIDAVDYQETQTPDQYGLGWDVRLRLIDFVTNTVFGTWDRAAGHDWDEAAAYSWDETRSW